MELNTLTTMQDEYIAIVNAGHARWAHRRDRGHFPRIERGARKRLERGLARLGFNASQVAVSVQEARDMAELIRISEFE